MTRVKVCGITREEDLGVAAAAGADAVGIISEVSVDTPREVSEPRARELVETAPPFVTTVLVTMARTTDRITELVESVGPDAVQIHADLTPPRVRRLAADLNASVIKVVDAEVPGRSRRYDGVADAVLVDSLSAEGGGGTGETHDWVRTREAVADLDSPVILAGGLTPENVATAVETVGSYAVDVASGVEREGGLKSHDAVRAFVANAKRAGRTSPEDGSTSNAGESVADAGSEVEP
jgi:phosphoribosylanthranilate isomerase